MATFQKGLLSKPRLNIDGGQETQSSVARVAREIKVAINERWKVTGISDTCSTQIPGVGRT